MFKALLINTNYQPLRFLNERRAIKLLFKEERVDILEYWNEKIHYVNGYFKYPSVIRLKTYVKYTPANYKFTRDGVFRRDNYHCKYCNIPLNNKTVTIDHVIPKSKGGTTDWLNCVTSCKDCNSWKMNLSLDEAKMKLKSPALIPKVSLKDEMEFISPKHDSWISYIG